MEPNDLRRATQGLLDEKNWSNGVPDERALVACFAMMSADTLNAFLRSTLRRCLLQLGQAGRDSSVVVAVVAGAQRRGEVDSAAWDFPGGGYLSDAVDAVEASYRVRRSALKSLGHALAAVEMVVGAVVEHRDHQRDPASWERYREHWMRDPFDPTTLSPERKLRHARDASDAWRLFLSGLTDISAQ